MIIQTPRSKRPTSSKQYHGQGLLPHQLFNGHRGNPTYNIAVVAKKCFSHSSCALSFGSDNIILQSIRPSFFAKFTPSFSVSVPDGLVPLITNF